MHSLVASKMKTYYKYILISFIIIGLSSCYRVIKDIDGNRHLIRTFRDYKKEENYRNKRYFKYCSCEDDTNSSKRIIKEEVMDYTFYEYDSIRVYLSPYFYWGFSTNDSTEAVSIFQNYIDQYGTVFDIGLITGKSFYCELFDSCKVPKNTYGPILNLTSGDPLKPNLFGYEGPVVKILYIEEITKKTKAPKNKRRFEIYATTSKFESGWGSFPMFILELENDNVKKETELKDFLIGAKVTCFMYKGTQI